MSMLMTTTLILSNAVAPASEGAFHARLAEEVSALSAPYSVAEDTTTKGRIAAISDEESNFSIRDEDGVLHSFTWNEKTKWTLDEKEVTRKEALVSGRDASIKHDDHGLASIVAVSTK